MPTPLQIDIPQEQAERITEKKRELGPYIFREAQVTWIFCSLLASSLAFIVFFVDPMQLLFTVLNKEFHVVEDENVFI